MAHVPKHIQPLVELIRTQVQNPHCGCEVGVFSGQLSSVLLREFPDLFLYMVDPWKEYQNGNTLHEQAEMDEAKALAIENTKTFADRRRLMELPSVVASKAFISWSFDFVFIDGLHTYEAVKTDVEAWLPRVKQGGLLCGHDYSSRRNSRFPVNRAVNEFGKKHGYEINVADGRIWWVKK